VDAKRQIPVMAHGEIVGRIAVTEDRKISRTGTLLGSFISGCIAFAFIYITLVRRNRQMRSELRDISDYANKIIAENGGAAITFQNETVFQTLDRVAAKVNHLESVRQTMIADIAHELRTPIAVIRTQLDNGLAAGQPWGPEKLMLLQDEIYRVSALIKDMQELTLAESHRLKLNKKWFNVSDLLDQVTEAMFIEAEEPHVRLDPFWDEECLLYADETRIRQILINLIGNAVKHARTRVTIRCDAAPHHVAISVQDDGMGLEEEEMPRVFDRFYRGTTHRKGLGLGLAIAKEYAEAHGGRIEVHSNWGQGALFVVTVPVFHE